MRRIDVFVSAAADVQNESAITEQLIRSVAAEFGLPVRASYSDPLRGSKEDAAVEYKHPEDESMPLVRVCFWDCPASPGAELSEWDQTQFDLIVCLLWSRLASVPVEACVLPNESRPWLKTDFDVESILARSQATSGIQRLRVYRNRATPSSLLEPKEEREEMCRQWDAVQDFLARWKKDNAMQFRECCQEFLDLEEFATLFRQDFRHFIVEQLYGGIDPKRAPLQNRLQGSNPFRGLNFFDFEHAAFYYGRTRAVGEVLDALKKQATAKKSLVLVLGPAGSGKSSLVRAGVLPLLTQGGTPVGGGPWRRVIMRPGVGDPIDTLGAALLANSALPELQDVAAPDESLSLDTQLKKDPENAASRITEVLAERKMRLALVVDQLEELFIGVSPVVQRKYVIALCALARCEGIYVIAALRSDFYAHYQRFPELVSLTSGGGRYELQLPTEAEIANMIRLPAEAAGLRFERDSETSRSLDNFLLTAAVNSSDPLPLLEHVLSSLYNRQLDRKDGLLLWSDYCQLGRFKNALGQHAEFVFLRLNRDEQHVFRLVARQLLAPGADKGNVFIRRPVPYLDLLSTPGFNSRQRAAAKGVIDFLTNQGLLIADTDSKHRRLISFPQDALLKHWPRLWRLLSEDQHFFGMRDRLDENLRLWFSSGEQSNHLLHDKIALAEAETLLSHFGSELSEDQIGYIKKSLAGQKRPGRTPNYLGLATIIFFALFAVVVVAERFISVNQRNQTKQDVQREHPSKDTSALESQLREAKEKVELAQQNDELASKQRAALEMELKTAEDKLKQLQDVAPTDSKGKALQTQLKEAEDKLKQVRGNSDEMSSQLTALQVQLKQQQDKAQKAQADADSLAIARNAWQSQLKQAEAKALLAQQSADLVSSQRSALETQLKAAQENLKQAQANSGEAARQLGALQTQLKQEQDKEQKAQANADSLTIERNALQDQLKATEDKLKQAQVDSGGAAGQLSALQAQLRQEQDKEQKAQANADSLTSERSALQDQLKATEDKLKQAQANSGDAAGQLSALQAQLRQEQDKEQKLQANADALTTERGALQSQLKATEDKLKLAQANSGAAGQLSALQAQLKQEQDKEQKAQANADSLTSERSALQDQLKATEDQLKQAQANSGDAGGQLSALQAQLKQEQDKEQKLQANADALSTERGALQSQLKATEDKLKQAEAKALSAQQNADLVNGQRSQLDSQLRQTEENLKQAQTRSEDAAGQLSALQAHLKQEQEKGQKAEANADSLLSERSALQSQLKQAEAKALSAQRNADLFSGQRNALEAQLKETEEKLKQTKPRSGEKASQLAAFQARLYLPQQGSPTPSPANNAPASENPSELQSSRDGEGAGNVESSGKAESLKEFVLGYLRTVASNDTSVQRPYFADRVRFYGRGVLDPSSVESSTEEYHREWPIREWIPRGEAKIVRLRHRDRFVVYQPFEWAVSDGSRHAQGNATLYLLIRRDSQGDLKIVSVHQIDR